MLDGKEMEGEIPPVINKRTDNDGIPERDAYEALCRYDFHRSFEGKSFENVRNMLHIAVKFTLNLYSPVLRGFLL